MTIRIINYKVDGEIGESVMRGTPLGNEFKESVYGRTKCIRFFKAKLWNQILSKGPMYVELCRLYKLWKANGILTLRCCCKPLACHGDVIRSALLWLDSEGALQDR